MQRSLGIIACSPLLLIASAGAQSTLVSPVGFAAVEGQTSNAFPFANTATAATRRYMQIHTDVIGTPMVVNRLSFRMQGSASSFAGSAACDMELFMGDARPYNQPSWVFANNYIGAPTQVLTRQVVNFGPLTAGTPAPFEFDIPLTTPFPYTGVNSLAWEAAVHLLTITAPFPSQMDVEAASITAMTAATTTGAGCIATGQASPMILTVTGADTPDTVGSTFSFGAAVDRGPANAATFLAIGASNPNLAVPGLCSNVYTDLLLFLLIGTTDGTGFLGTFSNTAGTTKVAGGTSVLAFPAVPGAQLFMQAHALDFGQAGIPLANSDGKSMFLPASNPARVRKLTRLLNNFGGVAQTNAIFFNTSNIGHGVVTEFTY
jgi:hypothetical protein